MKKLILIVAMILMLTAPAQAQGNVLAFPGAEGFGAYTFGGRGGAIYEVTNLNDSGTGSLRACVIASGARTCVFKVAGLITLSSPLVIANPYITIAGQTAPGGGITLKKSAGGDVFATQTHDVIIRYVSVRPGSGGENHANQIAKNGTELYNIIIDHNSLSWGVDSNIETWYRVRDATIQWSIISEGLDCSTHSKGCHSKGLMVGGYKLGESSAAKGSENISILNNLMAHNGERNPLVKMCGIGQVINNTTYNPFWTFAHQQFSCNGSYVNWVNNYHKRGPDSTSTTDLKFLADDGGTCFSGSAYVSGNYGANNGNWSNAYSGSCTNKIVTSPAVGPVVATTNATQAKDNVLASAGNNAGMSCDGTWFNRRDSIDARVVLDVRNGTGKIIDSPSEVGGWVTPAAGTPCTDSDKDGMSDLWEQAYGFNPAVKENNGDKDDDGYTNVEEYFNGTDPGGAAGPTNTPTQTAVIVPTATFTATNTPTATRTRTPTPTYTFTQTPAVNPTGTRTATNIPMITATPTMTPTRTPTSVPVAGCPAGWRLLFENSRTIVCYLTK